MWYVIQVISGQEQLGHQLMHEIIGDTLIQDCFIPMRERKIKLHGTWQRITERLFPGYLFIVTDAPAEVYEALKKVPRFTRLLGNTDAGFIPLTEKEIAFLSKFGDENHLSHLSQVEVEEGNKVRIVSGNLLDYEGQIVKINLHKRIAVVQVEFMGQKVNVHLGIEILEKREA